MNKIINWKTETDLLKSLGFGYNLGNDLYWEEEKDGKIKVISVDMNIFGDVTQRFSFYKDKIETYLFNQGDLVGRDEINKAHPHFADCADYLEKYFSNLQVFEDYAKDKLGLTFSKADVNIYANLCGDGSEYVSVSAFIHLSDEITYKMDFYATRTICTIFTEGDNHTIGGDKNNNIDDVIDFANRLFCGF